MNPIDHLAADFEVIQPMKQELPKILVPSPWKDKLITVLILLAIGATVVFLVHKNNEKSEETK